MVLLTFEAHALTGLRHILVSSKHSVPNCGLLHRPGLRKKLWRTQRALNFEYHPQGRKGYQYHIVRTPLRALGGPYGSSVSFSQSGCKLAGKTYSPPQVDRIWGIWESYYNVPKALFHLLKGGLCSFEVGEDVVLLFMGLKACRIALDCTVSLL